MRKILFIFILFLIAFVLRTQAQSDICATATVITPGNAVCTYQSGSSENATQSMAGCNGTADDDVWYQFVANSSEMHIKVNPSENYDAVFQLFSGSCGSLTSIFCKDAGGDNITEEYTATGLTPGNTYFIRVYDYGVGSGSNDFSICVFGVPSVTNDGPCSAIALPTVTPNCNIGVYTNVGATYSGIGTTNTCGADPNLGYGVTSKDVWFSAVVPSNGAIEVSTISGSLTDGAMEIFTGACGSLTRVACADDDWDFMPTAFASGLTPGETVFIKFWGFGSSSGTFGICASSPLNDECADATLICDFSSYGGITSGQYTIDSPDNMCGIGNPAAPTPGCVFGTGYTGGSPVQIDNNSWIKFVANGPTAELDVEVEYCEKAQGMQMQIFSGDGCTNFAAVSNFLETTASQVVTATGLTPGETYYIVVDGFNGDICNYTITAKSGVQVVEVTSSAGTSVCPGQPTQLTAESSGTTVAYSWSANPGGSFGTGLQTELVTVNVPTIYTVTVTGFCDVASTASITVTPDKTVTADFYAATTPANTVISPFPTTMTCDDDPIALWATDSATASAFLSPALIFVFTTDANTVADNTRLEVFEDAVSIYTSNPLPANTILTLYGEHLSPSSNYTFQLCDNANNGRVIWDVFDGNTGLLIGTDTLKTGSPCQTYGPFSPAGSATWSINTVPAALTQSDNGYANFNPLTAGIGAHQITYSWDNSVGCTDSETKTITVINPHDASWTSPGDICENAGSITLTDYIDVSASSTAGTWAGTGVTGAVFNPSGLNGPISITYTVAGTNCQDQVVDIITVNTVTSAVATTITECDDSTGDVAFDLTAENNTVNGGTAATVNWFSNATATLAIATPNNYNSVTSTVYAVVTNTNSCSDTTAVSIVLDTQPAISTANISECNIGNNTAIFNLTSLDNTVNTGNGNAVTWFLDANASSSIGTTTAFSSGSVTVYAVVTDGTTSCTDTTNVTLTMLAQPSINNLTPTICEDAFGSGSAAGIDLTSNQPNINAGVGISFSWFDNTFTAVPTPNNTTVNDADVFNVSVSNASGCVDTATVTYTVTGTIVLSDPNMLYCEDDFGLGTVDGVNLTTYNSTIYTGSGTETFIWFDDLAATNNVPDPTNVTLDNGTYDTFVVSVTDGTCTQNITVTATINSSPVTVPSSIELCDDQSGFGLNATFDLTSANSAVNNSTVNSVSWYDDVAALIPSATPTTYYSSAATVYAVVTDGNNCSDTTTLDLIVNPLPTATVTVTNATCFGDSDGTATSTGAGGTGAYDFVWSAGSQTTAVATGLDLGTYTVTISDTKNCSTTTQTTLTEPTQLTITNTTITQPLCNGGTDGSIVVSVSGGNTGYTYTWDSGVGTATETGLSSNTYNFTVSDAKNCSLTDNFTVSEPSSITVTTVTTDVSCNGYADGIATTNASGGTGTLTFAWNTTASNTGTTSSITGLTANTYTVTVVDDNACTEVSNVFVNEPTAISITLSGIDLLCNGDGNGIINTTVTGGTPTYTYNWSNSSKEQTLTGLAGGIYTLTITDAVTPTACFDIETITVVEPLALAVSSSITDISCAGGSIGAVNITVTGGTSNYSFNWSNTATTQSITGLTAGNYSLTTTDDNGCELFSGFTVAGSATALSTSVTQNNVSCNGNSNGQITVTTSGGTTPISYSWNTSATTASISGLSANTYQVTATDNNGCLGIETVTITEPSALSITTSVTNVSCNGGSEGQLYCDIWYGFGYPLNYTWSNGATTQNISGLYSGNYCVTITNTAGCQVILCDVVNQPSAVFDVTTTQTNINCGEGNVGAVTNTPSGGTTPYTFVWNTTQTNQSLTGLAPGNYAFTATDANGCSAFGNNTITGSPTALTLTSTSNDITCFGFSDGNATLTASGGATPYSYSWSTNETTNSISGLAQGVYEYTVTDVNGCTSTSATPSGGISNCLEVRSILVDACHPMGGNFEGEDEMFVFQTGSLPLPVGNLTVSCPTFVSTGSNNPWLGVCNNPTWIANTNASITGGGSVTELTTTDNIPPNSTVLLVTSSILNSTNNDLSGLTEDIYVIFQCAGNSGGHFGNYGNSANNDRTLIVDFGTCSQTVVYDRSQLVRQNGTNGAEDGATVNFDAAGNPTYVNYGCVAPISTISTTSGSSASITITEPLELNITTTTTDVTCFGLSDGAVATLVTGGTNPYSYLWNTSQTTATINGLSSTTVSTTITDSNSCTVSTSATVSEPAVLSITNSTVSDVLCNGDNNGSITIEAQGGVTNYSYNWSSGSSTNSQSGLSNVVENVTVTDTNNCSVSESYTITEPPVLTLTTTTTDVSCNGLNNGNATAISLGGFGSFDYLWNTSATTDIIENLLPNIYSVTVTDSNNCVETASATISEPSAITITTSETNVLCYGASTGVSNVTVSGGVPGYTYFWTNGQTNQNAIGLSAGNYVLRVTDSNSPLSCRIFHSITITEPSIIVPTVTTTATCFGESTGTATISSSGGISPYSYSWSNNQTQSTATGLASNTYVVSVTDDNGCTVESAISISSRTLPAANSFTKSVCENGDSTNFASAVNLTYYNDDVNAQAGNGVVVSWLDINQNPIINPDSVSLTTGDVLYAVAYDGYCSNTAPITFTTRPQAQVEMSGGGFTCEDGSNTVQIRLDFTGTLPISFTYSHDGEYTQVLNHNQGYYIFDADIDDIGYYSVLVVVNGNGCANNTSIDTVSVVAAGPTADFTANPTTGNPPLDVAFINNLQDSGFVSYYWQFGDGYDSHDMNPIYTYTEQGNYLAEVLLQDFRGCTDTMSIEIQVGDSSYFEIPIVFTPNGDGFNDVFKPIGYNIIEAEGVVFNRWGEKVFAFDKLNMVWDGRTFAGQEASEGTYFYIIKATGYDGVKYEETGTISLLR